MSRPRNEELEEGARRARFQEVHLNATHVAPASCAEIVLTDGVRIRLGANATPEQIEIILGMLAC